VDAIFDFKFSQKAIKILLVLIIAVFFMPFFFVSCSEGDAGADFSGFEISTGKYIGDYWQQGSLFGFALIVLPAVSLVFSFFAAKNGMLRAICRYLFFIAPIFDVFAAFVAWKAFLASASAKFGQIPVTVGIKPGFVFYMILNAALFAAGVANYFAKRE